MLFPELTPEEGWSRIDAALERASESERADRVDELAAGSNLDDELMRALRKIRSDEPT